MNNEKQLYVTQMTLFINKRKECSMKEVQYTSRLKYGKVPENFRCEYEDFDDFCLDCNNKPLNMMCIILRVPKLFGKGVFRTVSFSITCDNKPKKVTEKNFEGATLYVVYRPISEDVCTLKQLANKLTTSEFFEFCKDNLSTKEIDKDV